MDPHNFYYQNIVVDSVNHKPISSKKRNDLIQYHETKKQNNPLNIQFQNDKIIATYKKRMVQIDSSLRDKKRYPNSNQFKITLPTVFNNVVSLNLTGSIFPNTDNVIKSYPENLKNNKLYWINKEDLDLNYPVYEITLDAGNYEPNSLIVALTEKMNSIKRRNGTGDNHFFTISADVDTNIFKFSNLNLSYLASDPLTSSQGSQLIRVSHINHGFENGQLIYMFEASQVGGFDSVILNSTHNIIYVDANSYDIELSKPSSITETGGGDFIFIGTEIPFKFLFGEYSDTFADKIGFPSENSSALLNSDPITTLGAIKPVRMFYGIIVSQPYLIFEVDTNWFANNTIIQIQNLQSIPSLPSELTIFSVGTFTTTIGPVNGIRINLNNSLTSLLGVDVSGITSGGSIHLNISNNNLFSNININTKNFLLNFPQNHNFFYASTANTYSFTEYIVFIITKTNFVKNYQGAIQYDSFDLTNGSNTITNISGDNNIPRFDIGNVLIIKGEEYTITAFATDYSTITINPAYSGSTVLSYNEGFAIKPDNLEYVPWGADTSNIRHVLTQGQSFFTGQQKLIDYFLDVGDKIKFRKINSPPGVPPSETPEIYTVTQIDLITGRIDLDKNITETTDSDYIVYIKTNRPYYAYLTTNNSNYNDYRLIYDIFSSGISTVEIYFYEGPNSDADLMPAYLANSNILNLYGVENNNQGSLGGIDVIGQLNNLNLNIIATNISNVLLVEGLSFFTQQTVGGGDNVRVSTALSEFRGTQTNQLHNNVIFKPILLQGIDYVYICADKIEENILTLGTQVSNVIGMILLTAPAGTFIFNSAVNLPKIFYNSPLPKLDNLELTVRRPDGKLFDLNNLDYSFTLEVIELVEKYENQNIASKNRGTLYDFRTFI